jgi:hypothetical protein
MLRELREPRFLSLRVWQLMQAPLTPTYNLQAKTRGETTLYGSLRINNEQS